MDYDDIQKFIPRAVVETKKIALGKYIYNAEVMFNGWNYIVPGNPHSDNESAKKAAQIIVSSMIDDMRAAGAKHVHGLPVAKE